MANLLQVDMQHSIITLHKRGFGRRTIARMLDINRRTVTRYIESYHPQRLEGTNDIQPPPDRMPSALRSADSASADGAKCTRVSTGSTAIHSSLCEPYQEQITQSVASGLSAQRIYQDLASEHGFTGKYKSVQRFVRRLGETAPLPCRRMERGPGEEAQVDFGRGAPIVDAQDKRRHANLFRIVLSHSRKAYSEVVPRQTTDYFLRAIENAFRYFGGVTRTVIIDNLRAAVHKADWYEPEIHPKIQSFCEHYGTTILPEKPYRPELKGKVERSVGYVKDNALKGRQFPSFAEQNRYLLNWETTVADTRIHGTTRQQVRAAFECERPHLLPLPPMIFPSFEEGKRTVHQDQHVDVARAYYSAPPEYLGRSVWIRYDAATVRIFNLQWQPIAIHSRLEPGGRSTHPAHIPPEKISGVERGQQWQLQKAARIGPQTLAWAKTMLKVRGLAGVRVLQGLINLPAQYSRQAIDTACEQALAMEAFHLRDVKNLIRQPACQQTLQFLTEHELIRDLACYSAITAEIINQNGDSQP